MKEFFKKIKAVITERSKLKDTFQLSETYKVKTIKT